MDKIIKFEIAKTAKERSLLISFGDCKSEFRFQGKLRGRDVLAFDCFTENLSFQSAETRSGHALLSGATPYGHAKAEAFLQNASTLKIKASVTLKNQAQLDAFYFMLLGKDDQKVLTPYDSKAGWYSGEWPTPCGALTGDDDALLFLVAPDNFAKRQEWLCQIEAGERSLRFGTDFERSWPLNGRARSRKLEFTIYVAGSSVSALPAAAAQAAWQLARFESRHAAPDLKKLEKETQQELKTLIDKLSAPPDQAEAPVSFGKLLGCAFALARSAKENGQKVPAAAEKVLQLYKKAPRFKGLPPANYPYPGTFKKHGEPEVNLAEIARAGYWLARWENEVGATGFKDELKDLKKELISRRHRGGYIPEVIDSATNHVKKGYSKKRTSPWAVSFLEEIGCDKESYTPLLNTMARELLVKRSPASSEELIFAAKAEFKAFLLTGRENYRASGVKLLYRLAGRQQTYQPHYLKEKVAGLIAGAEANDFSEATLPYLLPLFLLGQKISGARMFEERAKTLLRAIQDRDAYFASRAYSALPAASSAVAASPLEKAALILSHLEIRETFGDVCIIPAQKRAMAFFEEEEPKLEKELLGYRLTINSKEKRRIKITSESGRVWEPTLKKGLNQIELY
ncbi:hypothetical protein J6U76_00225 [bacterium]|nr:hypothetical protein [bacterium]